MNLKLTLESGQTFLWYRLDGNWCIINGSDILIVSDDLKIFRSYNNSNINHIFRLNDDMNEINSSIDKDAIIRDAMRRFQGLRIMRQDPFQCLISFICSSNTNIKRIKKMLMNIVKIGKSVEWHSHKFNLFPEPKVLANISINELVRYGLGYRAKYVRDASHALANKLLDLEELKDLEYEEAKEELMRIKGVGHKVADCVLLFSLEHLEAFPIDTWILKVLRKYYEFSRNLTDKAYGLTSKEMREYFGTYAGYAQQYLYCYARS